jgi:tryptophanyl-tRNA synthetase
MNLMSGARLSSGGLHLGHYLGCLSPLSNFSENFKYFFVIRDRGEIQLSENLKANCDLITMMGDLMATSYASKIKIVLQSSLYTHYIALLDYIQEIVTLNQLENVHPKRKQIKHGNSKLLLKDFLFPLDSVCTYFILDAEYVIMNDDNLRFVSFAKRISQKIANIYQEPILVTPQLIHGKIPRLLGYNYQKVCKANNNCMFLSDSDDVLEQKVEKLFSFKYLFRNNPSLEREYSRSPNTFILPKTFLPLLYLQAFSDEPNLEQTLERFRNPRLQDELRSLLNSTLKKIIVPMREIREYYINHPSELWMKLEENTVEAVTVARGVESRVSNIVFSTQNFNAL